LSKSFAEYFVRKIGKLREAALGTLRRTPADLLSGLPDPPYTGQTVSLSEVIKLLHKSPTKSSRMDTIPTLLLLECHHSFSEIIAYFANVVHSWQVS